MEEEWSGARGAINQRYGWETSPNFSLGSKTTIKGEREVDNLGQGLPTTLAIWLSLP